jgi:spore maturation protein CgeB
MGTSLRRAFLFTAPSANNAAIPDSQVWFNNLYRGLTSHSIEVLLPSFDTRLHLLECRGRVEGVDPIEARDRYSALIVQDVRKGFEEGGLELFIAYLGGAHILPSALDEIRALGVPTILFFCNAAHQFHLIEEIAPHFDYCMVPERQALPKYREVGANPVHIQMAADPEMYKPYEGPHLYDVTFVGQAYLNRPEYIGYLAWNDLDVRVWGAGWLDIASERLEGLSLGRRLRRVLGDIRRSVKYSIGFEPAWYPIPRDMCGGILSDEEMVQIPGQSRISLNFSEVRDKLTGEIKRHIRLRDFEIPMSGGFMITGYQDELSEYYDIDREIVCYDTREELLDKCRYYLDHPQERERIRQAGYERAIRDHTWANRFRTLFEVMGLEPVDG